MRVFIIFLAALLFSLEVSAQPNPAASAPGSTNAVTTQCLAYYSPKGPALANSFFFGDARLAQETCQCIGAKLEQNSELAAHLASISPTSTPQAAPAPYIELTATLFACYAEKVRAVEPAYAASASAFLANNVGPLLRQGQRVKYVEAKVIEPKGCMPKEYPERARLEGAQGTTRLAYLVNKFGKQTNVRVVRSSGDTPMHKLLDFYAALSGTSCKFEPAQQNGEPVEGWAAVEVAWKLE